MRDDRIIIEPFSLLNVLRFTMKKKVNCHSEARFSGHIGADDETDYMNASLEGTWVKIMALQTAEPKERRTLLAEMAAAPVRGAVDVLMGKSFLASPNKAQAAAMNELLRRFGNDGAPARAQMARLEQIAYQGSAREENRPAPKLGALIAPYAIERLSDAAAFLDLLEARDALEVADALGAAGVLKSRGFRRALGVIGKLRASGVLSILEQSGPAAAANSDAAAEILGHKKILLLGVLTEFSIDADNGVKVARGTVRSATALMDTTPHIRTWHAPDTTYDRIIRTYLPNYPNGAYMMTEEDKQIDGLTVQYMETDWAFTVRMASRFNSFVAPDDATKDETEGKEGEAEPGVRFYFGMPEFAEIDLCEKTYSMRKDAQEFRHKRDNGLTELLEQDAVYTVVKSREVYPLGGRICLNGTTLYIAAVQSALEGGELYHRYALKRRNGFLEPTRYNFALLGASLPARVNAVTRDVIEVAVENDENQAGAGFRWLPYSTVYSTEDGTGWYCMPEPGDAVRLYLPDEDEAHGYVISSTHLVSAAKDERVNPDCKSIMNKQGKEVLFTPGSVTFTNNAGMSIELIDDVGIRIVSNKQIHLIAQEKATISSATASMEINAPEKITIDQNGTFTNLADDLVLKGKRVFIE